jgi:ribosome-binding ATPase YchF (GTP1/OBG family)
MMEASLKLLQDGKPVRPCSRSLRGRGPAILQHAQPADLQADALCLQRLRGRCGDRQCVHGSRGKWPPNRAQESIVISAQPSNPRWRSCPTRKPDEVSRALGLDEAGLDRLIRAGYQLLDLITYFTVGPKETRAWTIERVPRRPRPPASFTPTSNAASSAPSPSPMTTMSRSVAKPAKEAGKARDEGKEYVVQDGDVIHFRFNT